MYLIHIALIFFALLLIELLYFKIANYYNIIDQPNHRSSHTKVTLRGGGIIFALGALIFFFANHFHYPWFITGLLLIAVISFLDDIITLNNKVRLSAHLTAVALIFTQWELFFLPWYTLIIAAIFIIATINAYNFMDGINGITGSYSLLSVLTLYYLNQKLVAFTANEFLIITALALLVFNFFNFRKKAKCFAGDVGSVSMAFILVFFIGQLILKTHNFAYILLLLVYGLDTAFTVLFRKIRKENIFKAHRSHFYQFLVNEKKYPHLLVAALYFIVQLIINLILIFWVKESVVLAILLTVICAALYLLLRLLLEGRKRLFAV